MRVGWGGMLLAWGVTATARAGGPPASPPEAGETPPPGDDPAFVIEADETPGERVLDGGAVRALPGRSPEELLRELPGLMVSSHGGRGKAWQVLLRGFDAVHGADLAVSVEGIPMNEPSNVHGHGYLDLHLLPRAAIAGVSLRHGAFEAEVGDFAVAGSADYAVGLASPGVRLTVGGGTDRSGLARVEARPARAPEGTFLVAEADGGAGVTDARGWRQARVAAGAEARVGPTRLRGLVLAYDGRFRSPGAVAQRDLDRGRVGFWDGWPGSGGRSTRLWVAGLADGAVGRGAWSARAWGHLRSLALDQNFTGYFLDPVRGDGVRQTHDGAGGGLRLRAGGEVLAGLRLRGGLDGRVESFTQTVSAVDAAGTPWRADVDADGRHIDLAGWADLAWTPHPAVTLEGGARAGALLQALRRRVDDQGAPVDVPGWARAWAPVVAPKARLTGRPVPGLALALAWGRGLRSPEVRGLEDGQRLPVTRVDTVDLSFAWSPEGPVRLGGATFVAWSSQEIVFDPLQARFTVSGATRRVGGEVSLDARLRPWLDLRADLSYADGRYQDASPILYAPRLMASLGLRVLDAPTGPVTWSAGLRGRLIGPRPLPQGFVSRTTGALDGRLSAAVGRWTVALDLDNLLFARLRDGEFVFPSWWQAGDPRSELPVLQITAGDPPAARLSVSVGF